MAENEKRGNRLLKEYWEKHREYIYQMAEWNGFRVKLALAEIQGGIEAASDFFLEQLRKVEKKKEEAGRGAF